MGEFEVGASVVYYLFIILGSISPGYLAVRYTYPDVRTFSHEEKLGASVLLGGFVAMLAILADVLYSGLDAVFRAEGAWPVFWLASSAVAFLVLFVGLRRSDRPEVAVPATKRLALLQEELQSLEDKPPADKDIAARLESLRKKGVLLPQDKSVPAPVVEPLAAPSSPAVSQNMREAKRILEQARETEVETILNDLQLDYPAALAAMESGRHRRLYLAARQAPSKDDEKQIVEDVYVSFHDAAEANKKKDEAKGTKTPALLKDTSDAKTISATLSSKVDGKVAGAAAATAAASVSMADLFGEPKKAPSLSASPKSVFAQLDKEVTAVPVAQLPVCPTCKRKNSRIVFCPYCGTGMCANCSPKVIPGPDGFTYTCPKCQEDIPVKKKQDPNAGP